MAKKILEQKIADDIKQILEREVAKLKRKKDLEGHDAAHLEKYAKIYSIMTAAHREDMKSGAFGKMTDAELEELAGEKQRPDFINEDE
jgi:phage terminase small subunit